MMKKHIKKNKKCTYFSCIILLSITSSFIIQFSPTLLFALEKALYNTQNNQPCEHAKPIRAMGVRKFTPMEQRGLGFTSNQYLCYSKVECQSKPKPKPELPEGVEPDPEPDLATLPELPYDPEPGSRRPLPYRGERPINNSIPNNVKIAICDVTSCSNSNRECQCPTDPMECLKDTIDGRSSYSNEHETVKIDDEASGCESTSPIKAREITIEEQRQYGTFNVYHVCYVE